jgi:hypothetical protein
MMSEEMRMWVEVIFNVCYLAVVWTIVFWMAKRQNQVRADNRQLARRVLLAFALLALGDTGHVGLRVVAFARGGLAANPGLVGAGAFATAFTVTLFYMLMVDAWRLRFQKPLGGVGWFLLAIGLVRLIVLLFPQNQWGQVVAPYNWSLLRNSFLVIQGMGVMGLILRAASQASDRAFTWIGIMIALSYLFYAPVILWVQWVPILGMLMIPKTCAYLGVAFIAYRALYHPQETLGQQAQDALVPTR